jgi:hypothetical protein
MSYTEKAKALSHALPRGWLPTLRVHLNVGNEGTCETIFDGRMAEAGWISSVDLDESPTARMRRSRKVERACLAVPHCPGCSSALLSAQPASQRCTNLDHGRTLWITPAGGTAPGSTDLPAGRNGRRETFQHDRVSRLPRRALPNAGRFASERSGSAFVCVTSAGF